jgi:hypothetical protein
MNGRNIDGTNWRVFENSEKPEIPYAKLSLSGNPDYNGKIVDKLALLPKSQQQQYIVDLMPITKNVVTMLVANFIPFADKFELNPAIEIRRFLESLVISIQNGDCDLENLVATYRHREE